MSEEEYREIASRALKTLEDVETKGWERAVKDLAEELLSETTPGEVALAYAELVSTFADSVGRGIEKARQDLDEEMIIVQHEIDQGVYEAHKAHHRVGEAVKRTFLTVIPEAFTVTLAQAVRILGEKIADVVTGWFDGQMDAITRKLTAGLGEHAEELVDVLVDPGVEDAKALINGVVVEVADALAAELATQGGEMWNLDATDIKAELDNAALGVLGKDAALVFAPPTKPTKPTNIDRVVLDKIHDLSNWNPIDGRGTDMVKDGWEPSYRAFAEEYAKFLNDADNRTAAKRAETLIIRLEALEKEYFFYYNGAKLDSSSYLRLGNVTLQPEIRALRTYVSRMWRWLIPHTVEEYTR
ncbi:hypothetical protein ACFQH6_04710 [Halobacteriaceae archaeon GCM10025711]